MRGIRESSATFGRSISAPRSTTIDTDRTSVLAKGYRGKYLGNCRSRRLEPLISIKIKDPVATAVERSSVDNESLPPNMLVRPPQPFITEFANR
ncbi:hypothetical protein Bxe_C0816 [Paraburkholderia xenovorans LB400]|uniref:Uncharacterized protein n=1 Tax=Paraburkholderia xenovorans (strain LB400) TaxID=266265 RepID=Q13GU1_PARXL|nr:hypothetical protein Bxe_C0816 [Paraburkholderia xenovorans LB400]